MMVYSPYVVTKSILSGRVTTLYFDGFFHETPLDMYLFFNNLFIVYTFLYHLGYHAYSDKDFRIKIDFTVVSVFLYFPPATDYHEPH